MHCLRKLLFTSLGFVMLCLGSAAAARADTVIYTFEPPQFTVGQTTPLLNRAPNSGLATFRASFTSSPTAGGFLIANFQPNVLFSGQSLFDPLLPADVLTLTFNMPVNQVQLNWAVIEAGRLELISPVGSTSQTSAAVGGEFQGGTLVFSSSTPFTTFQLRAFTTAGTPTIFAIDNLTLNTAEAAPIPEPTTMLLLSSGLAGVGAAVRGRRRGEPRASPTAPTLLARQRESKWL